MGDVINLKQPPCSICEEPIDIQDFGNGKTWKGGHNAYPVNDGRCCTKCNQTVVIPARLVIFQRRLDGKPHGDA